MIIGRVTDALDIISPLGIVIGPDSIIELDAIIDTGFNGTVAIPKSIADQLSLKFLGSNEVLLADGRTEKLVMCEAVIDWAGQRHEVAALIIGKGCLVGMEMLQGSRLEIDVVPGGEASLFER